MNKLLSFLSLRGKGFDDNIVVNIEKLRYALNKILRIFINIEPYSMGKNMNSDILAINSYGVFFCRKNTLDLHIISDSYEYKVKEKIKEIMANNNGIFIDVGANVGKYSIFVSKINSNADVFAFEPEKNNYEILRKNLDINKLNKVNLLNTAIGEKNGKSKLYLSDENSGRHSMSKIERPDNFEIVETKTLDSLFEKNNVINLIKIDAEGFEPEIINGAKNVLLNKKIKNIIIEIDDNKILSVFKKYGYKLEKIQYNDYHIHL